MAASLSLNEIRSRALAFAREWSEERRESAEKQTFWNQFFDVFGIPRRRVATFEQHVRLLGGGRGSVDLFWPGMLLVEHKSRGEDLDAAFKQATDYFAGIDEKDLPRAVIVSDFARFRVYDLERRGEPVEFPLEKLHQNIAPLAFLSGFTFRSFDDAPEVNARAARLMARLHESLAANGYTGHPLAVLLVRLMFCFFADKTGIFPPNLFRDYMERMIELNHRNVGVFLMELFEVLNTPRERRQRDLVADLAEFEYVNGHLFEESIPIPAFGPVSKRVLQECMAFDWSAVSPAIFGAMFQGVMDEEPGRRREIGAHYTSEKNILKAINPLLVDGLRAEFKAATNERALRALLKKLAGIKVLDPACGCGNFLVIAYRELRQLEIEGHERLQEVLRRTDQKYLGVTFAQGIDVDAMHGIEIEEFPCRVAETALYLVDHQMNNRASEVFGENFRRLPLSKQPRIVRANALRIDWNKAAPAAELTCIVGNPPFVGKKTRNAEQQQDMSVVFEGWGKGGELDYVTAWYVKALRHIKGTDVPVTFVSTNSIAQGEQVGIFWPRFLREGARIQFAHRTFRWSNDAPGQASVYCVIVGWRLAAPAQALLYEYDSPESQPQARAVDRINPYLVDAADVFVEARRKPLCAAPTASNGSMPNDDGNLLFADVEYRELIKRAPAAKRLFRPINSSHQFLHGERRWCLWLLEAKPSDTQAIPEVRERIARVRRFRQASRRPATRELADTPNLFGEVRQPTGPYVLIPRHSSELRHYIPMAILPPRQIVSDSCVWVDSSDPYHFGVLQSTMHMAWTRHVCGRLESRYRYSVEIVYNNFPWPPTPTAARIEAVRTAAQAVLDARSAYKGQSLAELYDPDLMPTPLRKAHAALDRAVDACYGLRDVRTELDRVRFLFDRYEKLVANGQLTLPIAEPETSGKRRRKTDR